METAGHSSFHKVGPNDSKPNHEPGRGQGCAFAKERQPIENTMDSGGDRNQMAARSQADLAKRAFPLR